MPRTNAIDGRNGKLYMQISVHYRVHPLLMMDTTVVCCLRVDYRTKRIMSIVLLSFFVDIAYDTFFSPVSGFILHLSWNITCLLLQTFIVPEN